LFPVNIQAIRGLTLPFIHYEDAHPTLFLVSILFAPHLLDVDLDVLGLDLCDGRPASFFNPTRAIHLKME